MDELKSRQLAQMRFGIADFRQGNISLNTLISRLEGAARTIGQEFWERFVFSVIVELEQINVDLVEDCRTLTHSERMQAEKLIAQIELNLNEQG